MGQAKQKVLTSRELADAIDYLIALRTQPVLRLEDVQARKDEIEMTLRKISDGLKRLDHNPGVYFDDQESLAKPGKQA